MTTQTNDTNNSVIESANTLIQDIASIEIGGAVKLGRYDLAGTVNAGQVIGAAGFVALGFWLAQ